MGRPSTAVERREQILDAYGICLSRYGVDGATLEKISETAGLARQLIRHNIGNRDDLLEAFVARFLKKSDDDVAAMMALLPATGAAATLIDWLFDPKYADAQSVLVAEALIAAAQDNPALAKRMRAWTRRIIEKLRTTLEGDYPAATPEALDAVAAGVIGIYFNVESLTPLGAMKDVRNASRQAALMLLGTLEEPR